MPEMAWVRPEEKINMIRSFAELAEAAKSTEKKMVVAVVEAHDEHTIEAVCNAHNDGMIEAILIGKEDRRRAGGRP